MAGSEEGDVDCFYYLGLMSVAGEGCPKDYTRALYFYQQGAKEGDPRAMFNLALFYENGVYVPKNMDLVIYWLKQASERGLVEAKEKLEKLQ